MALMQRLGVISAAVLFYLAGIPAAACAQPDQQGTKQTKLEAHAKPEQRKGNRQGKSGAQRQERAQRQEKQQQDGAQQQRLAEGNDLNSGLAGVDPPSVGDQELRKALFRYTRLAREDTGEKLPMPTGVGYPGPPYPGYIRLTQLLRLLGDLPDDYSAAAASAQAYDAVLLQAVGHFQERHGLSATRYLDAETIEQLNIPLSYRVEQIRLALEGYRRLRNDSPQPTIVVNIPALRLYALNKEGKVVLTMRVDVGDDFKGSRTPVLEDSMEYLVFRPYWDVPLSIQRKDFVPFVAQHPGYLAEHHFDFKTSTGERVAQGEVTKEVLDELRAGTLRLRQRPGSDNPMGMVKFVFPNRYNVYLHDIPERDFDFVLPQRTVSHGCVHVEKPAELAAWVLRDQPGWTLERVQQAMHSGQNNVAVKLAKPLPVLIVYSTVSAGEDGDIHFYDDIYGYDADRLQVLAQGQSLAEEKLK
jgi:murein L,D-transpeptidase YcbB/YkuD